MYSRIRRAPGLGSRARRGHELTRAPSPQRAAFEAEAADAGAEKAHHSAIHVLVAPFDLATGP